MIKHLQRAGLAALLSLCLTSPAQSTSTATNTLKIQGAFEFSSLDPTRRGYVFTRMQMLESLLNVDESGQLLPGLATDWAISDDGLIWTLSIRSNVQFHDGTLLDARIVADNLNRSFNRPSALNKSPVASIEAVGNDKIQIKLTKPYRPLGAVLAHYSSTILAPSSFNDEGEVLKLIGTGPYAVIEVAIPHKLLVKKFDAYWDRKGSIEYVSYLTGHRQEARVLQARSGQMDITFGLDPMSVPMLQRLPNLEILRSDQPRTLSIKLNLAHPLLSAQETRQALSLAINRTGIATAILRSPKSATSQLLPASMQDWHLDKLTPEFDLERARQLLQAQGWQAGEEGWLEREGQRFELNLMTYSDRPELTPVATAIQDQWKQLGVKLNVHITSSSSIPAGHQDGSLEVALIARNYGTIADPLGILIQDFGQVSGGDWGSMNWSRPDVQQQLNALTAENDPQRYRAQAQTIARAIQTDLPLIPVASYVQHTAINTRVQGFRFDPYERSYFLNELSWR